MFLRCAVYEDSAKYLLLFGNSNEDRIGRQSQEFDFLNYSPVHIKQVSQLY